MIRIAGGVLLAMLALQSAGCNLLFGIEELEAGTRDGASDQPDAAPDIPDANPLSDAGEGEVPTSTFGYTDLGGPPVLLDGNTFWMIPLPALDWNYELYSFGFHLARSSSAQVVVALFAQSGETFFPVDMQPGGDFTREGPTEIMASSSVALTPDLTYWFGILVSEPVELSSSSMGVSSYNKSHDYAAGLPEMPLLTELTEQPNTTLNVYIKASRLGAPAVAKQ